MSQYKDENFKKSLKLINNEIDNPELNLKSFNQSDQFDVTNLSFYCNFDDGVCKGSPFLSVSIQCSLQQRILYKNLTLKKA